MNNVPLFVGLDYHQDQIQVCVVDQAAVVRVNRACVNDAELFARAIRQHWGIENQLHWRLDVSMNEDQCRLRIGHGAENFSRLRRIALDKLRRWEIRKENGKVKKASLRLKQQACGWSHKFLIEALLA